MMTSSRSRLLLRCLTLACVLTALDASGAVVPVGEAAAAHSAVSSLGGLLQTIPAVTASAPSATLNANIEAFLFRAQAAGLAAPLAAPAAAPVPSLAPAAAPAVAAVAPAPSPAPASAAISPDAQTLSRVTAALAPFNASDIRSMPAESLENLARRIWDDLKERAPLADRDWSRGVFLPETVPQALPGDALGVTVHRLSNGLTVYLSPNRAEPRVHYNIAVRAGSRHDPLEATGMAHYLEHMQFKGTQKLGTADYEKEKPHLDRIQALYDRLFTERDPARRAEVHSEIDRESQAASQYAIPNEMDKLFATWGFTHGNAHTYYEETVYKGEFPSNRADVWAQVETDRLSEPVYRIFQPELETIYKEYNMGKDDAGGALWEAAFAATFPDHPYGRDVIGLGEHLKNPSISRMQDFFKARYRPNNMAIALSGDFEPAEMLARLERTFGTLKPAPIPPGPAAELRPLRGVERREVFSQESEALAISWRLPGSNSDDEDALLAADQLMTNGSAGLLDLLKRSQKIADAGSYPMFMNDAGAWFVTARPKEGQTLEEAERAVLDAVERLKAGDFSEQDLAAAVMDLDVRERAKAETNEDRVETIRDSFIKGTQWSHAAGRVERLRRLTKADIVRVANRYLGGDRAVAYRRKGESHPERVPAPQFTPIGIDSSRESLFAKELSAQPSRASEPRFLVEGRDYAVAERPWGRLYSAPGVGNGLSELEFRFDLGVAAEPRMPLALKILESAGAGGMSVEEFQKALYRLGASLHISLDQGRGTESDGRELRVKIVGPDENLREALRLTLLRFTEPTVEPGVFSEMIAVERGARRDRKTDPEEVFKALKAFASRGARSPVLNELSAEGLDAVSEDDLRGVLRTVFQFKRDALYSGGLRADEVSSILDATGGSRPAPVHATARLESPARARVIFVHMPDQRQALLGAYVAEGDDVSARAVASLYDTLMEGMNGIWFQEMRESRALAYTAAGGHKLGNRAGDDNRVWAFVSAQADQAVAAMRLMLTLLTNPPVTAERFAAGLRQALESYRTVGVAARDIPSTVLHWFRKGLGGTDPRAESYEKAQRFTPAQLDAFIARFKDKPLTFYVVGDRAQIDIAGLRAMGDFEERSVDDIFPF